jgi:hypothetical protein
MTQLNVGRQEKHLLYVKKKKKKMMMMMMMKLYYKILLNFAIYWIECRTCVVNTFAWYSGGLEFKPWPGDWLV